MVLRESALKILLLHLDGKFPNIALMRISAHHKARGDEVTLKHCRRPETANMMGRRIVGRDSYFDQFDKVYASLIFTASRPIITEILNAAPDAIIGGTGWNLVTTLQSIGIITTDKDYSIYPLFEPSIGYTQTGCRLSCTFCVVPTKEGKVAPVATINEIWRGDPWPREIVLLDNDFFGQPNWAGRIKEMRDGDFKVSFSQGINARMLNEETANAIAMVRCSDNEFDRRCIYTAWDNRRDERRLFAGLEALVNAGFRPRDIMVYMLISYCHRHQAAASLCQCEDADTHEDRDYRRRQLRAFGAVPYPMPFEKNQLTLGFQRWVVGAFDKSIPWREWLQARCQPRNLHRTDQSERLFA